MSIIGYFNESLLLWAQLAQSHLWPQADKLFQVYASYRPILGYDVDIYVQVIEMLFKLEHTKHEIVGRDWDTPAVGWQGRWCDTGTQVHSCSHGVIRWMNESRTLSLHSTSSATIHQRVSAMARIAATTFTQFHHISIKPIHFHATDFGCGFQTIKCWVGIFDFLLVAWLLGCSLGFRLLGWRLVSFKLKSPTLPLFGLSIRILLVFLVLVYSRDKPTFGFGFLTVWLNLSFWLLRLGLTCFNWVYRPATV